jgi:hypothetical protein
MNISSLPKYPQWKSSQPSPARIARADKELGRKVNWLTLIFILTICSLVYASEQFLLSLAAISQGANLQIYPELTGKWKSLQGDGCILHFESRRFTISRDGTILLQGGYWDRSDRLEMWATDDCGWRLSSGWPSRPFDWLLSYDVKLEELALWGWDASFFAYFVLKYDKDTPAYRDRKEAVLFYPVKK